MRGGRPLKESRREEDPRSWGWAEGKEEWDTGEHLVPCLEGGVAVRPPAVEPDPGEGEGGHGEGGEARAPPGDEDGGHQPVVRRDRPRGPPPQPGTQRGCPAIGVDPGFDRWVPECALIMEG